MVDGPDSSGDGAAGGVRTRARGVDGAVRGPLKNFRGGGGRRRVGGIRRRRGGDDVDDDDPGSDDSAGGSSADDYAEDGSKVGAGRFLLLIFSSFIAAVDTFGLQQPRVSTGFRSAAWWCPARVRHGLWTMCTMYACASDCGCCGMNEAKS